MLGPEPIDSQFSTQSTGNLIMLLNPLSPFAAMLVSHNVIYGNSILLHSPSR